MCVSVCGVFSNFTVVVAFLIQVCQDRMPFVPPTTKGPVASLSQPTTSSSSQNTGGQSTPLMTPPATPTLPLPLPAFKLASHTAAFKSAFDSFWVSRCRWECMLCKEQKGQEKGLAIKGRLNFFRHVRQEHDTTVSQYRSRFGSSGAVEKESLPCAICGKQVFWDEVKFRQHLLKTHDGDCTLEKYYHTYLLEDSQEEVKKIAREVEGMRRDHSESDGVPTITIEDDNGDENNNCDDTAGDADESVSIMATAGTKNLVKDKPDSKGGEIEEESILESTTTNKLAEEKEKNKTDGKEDLAGDEDGSIPAVTEGKKKNSVNEGGDAMVADETGEIGLSQSYFDTKRNGNKDETVVTGDTTKKKRKRGRPKKDQKEENGEHDSGESKKRKRGRPKKDQKEEHAYAKSKKKRSKEANEDGKRRGRKKNSEKVAERVLHIQDLHAKDGTCKRIFLL